MKKYCAVRFDDVCPTMDRKQFKKAFSLMREYNIKPLIGVIPNNKDEEQQIDEENVDFWKFIKSLQEEGFSIAMHGLIHVYDNQSPKTIVCGKKHSEFAGHSYEVQYEKIKKGKEILNSHGVFTDVFFAPGHTYDKNTLKALYANGFRYLSDGLSAKPYIQNGIKCIPCRSFSKVKGNGIYVLVAHPNEWNRLEKANRFQELKHFCVENQDFFVSFEKLKALRPGFLVIQKILEKVFYIKLRIKKLLIKVFR